MPNPKQVKGIQKKINRLIPYFDSDLIEFPGAESGLFDFPMVNIFQLIGENVFLDKIIRKSDSTETLKNSSYGIFNIRGIKDIDFHYRASWSNKDDLTVLVEFNIKAKAGKIMTAEELLDAAYELIKYLNENKQTRAIKKGKRVSG